MPIVFSASFLCFCIFLFVAFHILCNVLFWILALVVLFSFYIEAQPEDYLPAGDTEHCSGSGALLDLETHTPTQLFPVIILFELLQKNKGEPEGGAKLTDAFCFVLLSRDLGGGG